MKSSEVLIEVADELGVEINYIYKEGKHSMPEDIAAGVAASIIFELIKGSHNMGMIKAIIKFHFDEIRSKLVRGEVEQVKIDEDHVQELLDIILKDTISFSDQFKKDAEKRVRDYLIELGFPKKTAKEKAEKVVKKLFKILKK